MTQTRFQKVECPTCKKTSCFEHCNFCGKDIKWTNHLGDGWFEKNKQGKRVRYPYEKDDSVHRCMRKGQKKYVNTTEINEYKLDDFRTIRRYRGPEFKCDLCGRVADLPIMLEHHKNNQQFDCNDKLMKQFFKEKPKHYIDIKNHRLSEFE